MAATRYVCSTSTPSRPVAQWEGRHAPREAPTPALAQAGDRRARRLTAARPSCARRRSRALDSPALDQDWRSTMRTWRSQLATFPSCRHLRLRHAFRPRQRGKAARGHPEGAGEACPRARTPGSQSGDDPGAIRGATGECVSRSGATRSQAIEGAPGSGTVNGLVLDGRARAPPPLAGWTSTHSETRYCHSVMTLPRSGPHRPGIARVVSKVRRVYVMVAMYCLKY